MTGATRACLKDLIASATTILEAQHGREVARLKAEHARQILDLKREVATLRAVASLGSRDEIEWDLSKVERRVFQALASQEVATWDDLFRIVERDNHSVTDGAIKAHILSIRRKLDPYGFRILSMRGKGYRLSRLISAS